ncbi:MULTISPECIES: transporter substrate-binding domain-containing protein [unclassified Halomonas]|uniref:substrate-binding periplasmic protein n=1 Tax=unclassified Halomonas TaxID=2609666 RepID=UPI001EF73B0C|nr:transporter substrate-binding domain-containing protein [Halomonas sp. MMH1-48]MCG7605553.1 transporter substrate-binding domain-containing protein [Halomonas sp. MM17-34]MCG7614745.1 transporter substrate-binding domain-containing protein [Halomonas sp. MM17-29]MCG7621619.1 transporter substrate-binding domain-containing protein [Halomonas sp. DSH1-27]
MRKKSSHKSYALCLCIAFFLTLVGCRYPQNVERKISDIEGGTLFIGITENPPWVIATAAGPKGVDIGLLSQFANSLDASIEWHWGSENELLKALNHHQLDIVAGGFTHNTRLTQLAATTRPYFTSHHVIGIAPHHPSAHAAGDAALEGQDIAVARLNSVTQSIRALGATPVITERVHDAPGWVAGPQWWLEAHGFRPTAHRLTSEHHVMALPKGENALMLALQRHLNAQSSLYEQLKRVEAAE